MAPVVKLHTKLAAIGIPSADSAPVVTVKVMRVFRGRETVGTNFAVLLAAVYETAPAMGVVPGPAIMNDVPLMLPDAIAVLKVTVIAPMSTGTLVTPHAGVVDSTAGTGRDTVQLVQSEHPAITSASGTINANKHNHFIFTLLLHMVFLLRLIGRPNQ